MLNRAIKHPSDQRTIELSEWFAEGLKRFGEDRSKWRFKCVMCGQTQSVQEFTDLGLDADKAYFSCIGRHIAGRGCDWTLGGLFQIHTLQVKAGDDVIPVFEYADETIETATL